MSAQSLLFQGSGAQLPKPGGLCELLRACFTMRRGPAAASR